MATLPPHASAYALGSTAGAMRRLEIQDAQFADVSERLLDDLRIRPADRVVELGIGIGSFSRRILRRLGPDAVLVGVDYTQALLDQAGRALAGVSPARLELVLSDIRDVGAWVAGAEVVVGRTVLHHLALPEVLLGKLRRMLSPGTRLGFIEPEFRVLIARLADLEAHGRAELAPLRRWAEGISRYYQACGLAPTIGATLGHTLEVAGYRQVRCHWSECAVDDAAIENMLLYYDEIRDKYQALGIATPEQMDEDKRLLTSLPARELPAVWGTYRVTCLA
jgi:ubiquinone/menaquinone biosynthesis C-methylase UbiE